MAGPLLIVLATMVLLMQVCIRKLAARLRDYHPATFNETGIENLSGDGLPLSEDSAPLFRLMGFCWHREYLRLGDAEVSRLGGYLRTIMVVWPLLFVAFAFTMVKDRGFNRTATAAPIAAPAPALASFEDRREAAYVLHRAMKWPEAIAAYDALVQERAGDAEVLFWRGTAQWKSAHFDEALRDFRRVAELDPTNFEAHRNVDFFLARQKRWSEALALWDGYVAYRPRDPEAYFHRGRAFFENGSLAAARADLAKSCGLGKAQACTMLEKLKDK